MRLSATACCLVLAFASAIACGDSPSRFQEVLALSDLDPNNWPLLAVGETVEQPTWLLCQQLNHRLVRFSPKQLHEWAAPVHGNSRPGELVEVLGIVEQVDELPLSVNSAPKDSDEPRLSICRFTGPDGRAGGRVITSHVPQAWLDRETLSEPTRFLGVVLSSGGGNTRELLLLTNHLGWLPTENADPGVLLLASQGVDVTLLDEVKHRAPFVKAGVSREGEAFYTCLNALAGTDPEQLATEALKNVQVVADYWQAEGTLSRELLAQLRDRLKEETEPASRARLSREIESTRKRLAMSAAVERQAKTDLSSVAPLFLQPDQETGQLVRIEGIARRALRIPAEGENIGHYYELEVFPPDSQNLPVVCCLTQLPAGFPVGDKIRAAVRVEGLFFKSWLYRTRKNLETTGQTEQRQQMYTPVVLGQRPVWIAGRSESSSQWGLWGGIVVLLGLAALGALSVRSSQRERSLRNARLPASESFPEKQLSDSSTEDFDRS